MKRNKAIHVVIGTKAQLIKMAPIMYELQKRDIPYNFIFTGQHQETIDDISRNFSIKKPDFILYHGKDITGIIQMFFWLCRITLKSISLRKSIFDKSTKTHILLTHGDTFSTLFGAILGKINRAKVAHIESGLRSFNIFHPFPEELTRLLTFCLSNYYFSPGEIAIKNLEKFKGEKINTQYNTLLDSLRKMDSQPNSKVDIPKEKYFICSCHRFENIFNKKNLEKIIEIIEEESENIKCLFVLHPATKKQLEKFNLYQRLAENKNIELRPRYDYFDFISLLKSSAYIMTDGGSNQEECTYLGIPCLLLRKATERHEGLGENVLISNYDKKTIQEFTQNFSKFKRAPLYEKVSPTNIIIDELIKITKNEN